jgi:sulfopyruvate decarboxylase TPP-binding subunit
MVKAKDFWEYLCEELDYRFFAGVPCLGLKPLYDTMSSKFMHYVPAVNEKVALGLVSGANIADIKGAVLMDSKNILDLSNLLVSFNKEYKVPVLIICYDEEYYWTKKHSYVSNLLLANFSVIHIDDKETFKDSLKYITEKIRKENKPGIFFMGEGDLE